MFRMNYPKSLLGLVQAALNGKSRAESLVQSAEGTSRNSPEFNSGKNNKWVSQSAKGTIHIKNM